MLCHYNFYFLLLGVEKVIGWALSHHFMQSFEAVVGDAKLGISNERYKEIFMLKKRVSH